MKPKLLSVLMLSVLLSACGSDGGSSGTPSGSAASGGSGGTGSGSTTGSVASTSGSDSGDCFTNAALYTTGNNYQIDVDNLDGNGAVVRNYTNRFTVTSNTTFKGNAAVELQTDTLINTGVGAGSTTQVKNYTRLESSESVTFGEVAIVSTLGMSLSTTIYYEPALRKPYTLALNTPRIYTYTVKTEGTAAIPDKTQTLKETFLGTETISVPAGSFKACKMSSETTMDGITTKSTSWSVAEGPYRGLFLQSADGNGAITARTTLLRFNGV